MSIFLKILLAILGSQLLSHYFYTSSVADFEGMQNFVRESGGWKFRINVFGWKRKISLERLMNSLEAANYMGYDVPLHFWVDGDADPKVTAFIDAYRWPHGEIYRHFREERMGLMKNLGSSWNGEDGRMCFFFEDDVEVSPYFFEWTLKVLEKHNSSDPNLIGISLVGLRLNQNTARMHQRRLVKHGYIDPITDAGVSDVVIDRYGWNTYGAIVDYRPHNGSDVVAMQVASSWGSLYFPERWKEFFRYFVARCETPEESEVFAIPDSNTVYWRRSWKLFLNEMMVARSQYMIYPNLPNQISFSTTHREKGEHTSARGKADEVLDALTLEKNWLFSVPLEKEGTLFKRMDVPAYPSMLDHYHLPTTLLDLQLQACGYLRKLALNLGMTISYPNGRQRIELAGPNADYLKLLFTPEIVRWCERHFQERGRFEPSVTVFTTLAKPQESDKLLIVDNTLGSYASKWPDVRLIVYSSKEDCGYFQGVLLVDCVPIPDQHVHPTFNLPELNFIFRDASIRSQSDAILYVNADITIISPLAPVINIVKKKFLHYLLVGQRTDYHEGVTHRWNFNDPKWDSKLWASVLLNSSIHPAWGMDYFLMDKNSPIVHVMPPFLVGCVRWDNWMVKYAILEPSITVVDSTVDINAIHIKSPQEKYYESRGKPGNRVNFPYAGHDYRIGVISNAPFRLDNGKVETRHGTNVQQLISKEEENWKIQFEAERASNWTQQFHSRKKAEEFLAMKT